MDLKQSIKAFADYFELHYQEDISENQIENITTSSYNYFRCYFRNITGVSLGSYIKRRRLALIMKAVRDNSYSIVGHVEPYSNERNFSSAFKKEYGCTPTDYLDGKASIKLQENISTDFLLALPENIRELINDQGGPLEALLFLFSLPPFYMYLLPCLSDFDTVTHLAELHYNHLCGNIITSNRTPDQYLEYYRDLILKYYDLENPFMFVKSDEFHYEFRPMSQFIFAYKYAIVKSKYIECLLRLVDESALKSRLKYQNCRSLWCATIYALEGNMSEGGYKELVCLKGLKIDEQALLWNIVYYDAYSLNEKPKHLVTKKKYCEILLELLKKRLIYLKNPLDETLMDEAVKRSNLLISLASST